MRAGDWRRAVRELVQTGYLRTPRPKSALETPHPAMERHMRMAGYDMRMAGYACAIAGMTNGYAGYDMLCTHARLGR